MNEKQAIEKAKSLGLSVSKTTKKVLEGRFVFYSQEPAIRYELKVNDVVCFYENDNGGRACWKYEVNGQVHNAGRKAYAIEKAILFAKK